MLSWAKNVKMAHNILAATVAALINKSIKTGIFPDQLKMAKIYPIHSKSNPAYYRPISILPTVSKIFEKKNKKNNKKTKQNKTKKKKTKTHK